MVVVASIVACQSSGQSEALPQKSAPSTPARAVANGIALEPVVIGDARDIAARDAQRHPDQVISALGILPGQRVADIGAGFGYFTFRIAAAVGPTGRVVATDIDPGALDKLRSHKPMPDNVIVRNVAPDGPGLEPGSYDLVFLSEVDHYLPNRVAYLTKLHAALAPNGRIAVTNRFDLQPPFMAAAEQAGYSVVSEVTDLPFHYLVFLRPASH